jgi:tungstate transport system ATP-binding protein
MEYIYNISNLQKEYNGRVVLSIKELNICEGQITCLIGPSGSGKSTLLHILNRIELPSKGFIKFNGYPYPNNGNLEIKIRRQMAMIFQKPIVFNNNVYENIAYGLKLRKMSRIIIRELVEEIAETVGLKDMLRQNAKTLSGGEAQRVALARAIILKPRVLFMDEATTNLDPANVILIENMVKFANSNYKTSIILATHNMNQAKRLSKQVIFLLNGNLIETGDTKTVFENPKDQSTKSFIEGDMIW